MPFASPDIAYTTHPSDALFRAHFTSSVGMAVYLIGGAAFTAAALISMGLAPQWGPAWTTLPYGLIAATLLWLGLGAVVIQKLKRQVQRCNRRYNAYVQQHTSAPVPTVAQLPSDEPWELRAFWQQQDHPSPAARAPHNASVVTPTPMEPAQYAMPPWATPSWAPRTAGAAHPASATTLEVDLIASMTTHKPLRPISLFGSVQ